MRNANLFFLFFLATLMPVGAPPPTVQGPAPQVIDKTELGSRSGSSDSGSGSLTSSIDEIRARIADEYEKDLAERLATVGVQPDIVAADGSGGTPTLTIDIAFAPDPKHTHLSLFFDRQLDAIQQGAQDCGFVFAYAYMPWSAGSESPSSDISGEMKRQALHDETESYPGYLIFRRTSRAQADHAPQSGCKDNNKSSNEVLLLFVVAEKPTSGVRTRQLEYAMNYWARYHCDSHLGFIGPTFTGSLASFARTVRNVYDSWPDRKDTQFIAVSGTVSGATEVIRQSLAPANAVLTFQTLQYSSNALIHKLERYLSAHGYDLRRLALLSEDETAYGSLSKDGTAHGRLSGRPGTSKEEQRARPTDLKRLCAPGKSQIDDKDQRCPIKLYFPREISTLRTAYQRELAEQPTPEALKRPPRTTLHTNLADEGADDDTVHLFSAVQTPLSQEAVMMDTITALRLHHIEWIVVRATDSMDQLFMVRYLQDHYPTARIVLLSSDLLLRRTDDVRFQGLLSLSTYPQLPGHNEHITGADTESHVDRIFPGTTSVGTYNATLSVLGDSWRYDKSVDPPVVVTETADLFGYGCPRAYSDVCGTYQTPYQRPIAWLTAIGNDGFWPLAVLPSADPKEFAEETQFIPALARPPTATDDDRPRSRTYEMTVLVIIILELVFAYTFLTASVASRTDFARRISPVLRQGQNHILVVACCVGLSLLWLCTLPLFRAGLSVGWRRFISLVIVIIFLSTIRALKAGSDGHVWKAWVLAYVIFAGTLAITLVLAVPSKATAWLMASSHRAIHLNSGLSPLVPIALLLFAILLWCYQALNGMKLLGVLRQRLPGYEAKTPGDHAIKLRPMLQMISDRAAAHVTDALKPASFQPSIHLSLLLCGIVMLAFFATNKTLSHTVMSLEGTPFNFGFVCSFAIASFLLLSDCGRLLSAWSLMERFLDSLDAFPLRRGFSGLHGFKWNPLWDFGGDARGDMRRLLLRQMEAYKCLKKALERHRWFKALNLDAEWLAAYESYLKFADSRRGRFTLHRSPANFQKSPTEQEIVDKFVGLLKEIAYVASATLNQLQTAWNEEFRYSGNADPADPKEATSEKKKCAKCKKKDAEITEVEQSQDAPSYDDQKKVAEQFVCLVYLGFILAVIVRFRSLIISIAGIFVFILLSTMSYPFEPRSGIQIYLIVIFVIMVASVIFVYAQMHRNATLSRITDSEIGELGADFWLRIASFLAIPTIGLLASQFPIINRYLFFWVQPLSGALK